jgi:membrane-associated phospholipid phosphatase
MKQLFVFLFQLLSIFVLHSQEDSLQASTPLLKVNKLTSKQVDEANARQELVHSPTCPLIHFIIPAALISYGVASKFDGVLRDFDLEARRETVEHRVKMNILDDYTQFAPIVFVYGLDWAGLKAKHNAADRSFVLATSYLIMASSVQIIKTTTNVERPNGSALTSFPSGHTATVFVGAHILFKEYKDISPFIGIAGYVAATYTGILRVMNNRHWFGDVVAGAGFGIMSAEAGYLLLPVFHKIIKKNLVAVPVLGNNNYGAALSYTF